MTTNEIFAKMLDYLYSKGLAKNQVDIGRKTGINPVTISRILNGKVKSVKPETLRSLNAAYGNVFNPEWLRGTSDIMLIEETTSLADNISFDMHGNAQNGTPDTSSLFNAVIASKDDAIVALKRELAAKEETISTQRLLVSEKENMIQTLKKQADEYRQQVSEYKKQMEEHRKQAEEQRKIVEDQRRQIEELKKIIDDVKIKADVEKYPFPTAVSEMGEQSKKSGRKKVRFHV